MNGYSICNDYLEIIAGTNNRYQSSYMEAAKNIDKSTPAGLGYLKNFIVSIENIASKDAAKDPRITQSNGNIKNFTAYENIKTAINFLSKNLSAVDTVKECSSVLEMLEKYQPLYSDGYDKNVRLIILEYECAVYMLVTSLSMVMANNMDVVANGTEIRIQKKKEETFGIIPKTLKDLEKQLKSPDHKRYLEALISEVDEVKPKSIGESYLMTEAALGDTIELISGIVKNTGRIAKFGFSALRAVKRSVFGIIPIIRSIIYLKYKRKADTILSLEQQMLFIQNNIERLERMTTMDPKKKEVVIKKQQATIERYKKKAAKLRAELIETEKDAAESLEKENPKMKNDSSSESDDDFVLENGMTIRDLFTESKKRHVSQSNKKGNEIDKYRIDKTVDKISFSAKKSPEEKKPEIDPKIQSAISKAIEQIKKDTKQPSIVFKLTASSDDSGDHILDSKIGGTPYWPADKDWPTYNGNPLVCVAQLNLSKLPKLEGYPSSGLIQFFLDSDEIWDTKDGVKVVYHESAAAKNMETVPVTTLTVDERRMQVLKGKVWYISGTLEDTYISPEEEAEDYNIWDVCVKAINEVMGESWIVKNVPDEINDVISDTLWKELKQSWGTRFGGHPSFTQSDTRKKGDKLLFQIDSEAGIMWGDCGIANFFINEKDLKSKNFEGNVTFTWDCY